jgi:hypothetical protein
MAAWTRLGAMKASEIVRLTLRMLQFSRDAISSVVAPGFSNSSANQRRPRAIDAINTERVSRLSGVGPTFVVMQGYRQSIRLDVDPGDTSVYEPAVISPLCRLHVVADLLQH